MKTSYPKNNLAGIFIFLLLFFLAIPVCYGGNIAVMPVEDLSVGPNNIDWQATTLLEDSLRKKGLQLIKREQLLSYLATNRIRTIGTLTAEQILLLGSANNISHLLLSSISEKDSDKLLFGLTLSLIDCRSGIVVWSQSNGLSRNSTQHLLGLHTFNTIQGVMDATVAAVMQKFPDISADSASIFIPFLRQVSIDSVYLSPRHVKPGDTVHCTVRFKQDGIIPDKVLFKVGNEVFLASKNNDDSSYHAAWPGVEKPSNDKVQVAMISPVPGLYEGKWQSPSDNSTFKVAMITVGGDGTRKEHIIGSYRVDDRPPMAEIKTKAKEIDGLPSFTDTLSFFVYMPKKEPLSHWQIHIEDSDGNTVVKQESKKKNCVDTFSWNGQVYKGGKALDGIYSIVLQLWDMAGNFQEIRKKIRYLATPQQPKIAITPNAEDYEIQITSESLVPLDYWKIQIWSLNDDLVYETEGNHLPATLPINGNQINSDSFYSCKITGKDALGNVILQRIPSLSFHSDVMDAQKTDKKTDDGATWIENF